MSTQNSQEKFVQTGKFYTSARNFQELLGVLPDGTPIPGGPYTISQFIVAVVVLILGFISRPIWGMNAILDVLIIAGIALGVAYGMGKMPRIRRNFFNVLSCFGTLITRPGAGRYRGRPIQALFALTKAKKTAEKRRQKVSDLPMQNTASAQLPTPTHEITPVSSGLDRLRSELTTA